MVKVVGYQLKMFKAWCSANPYQVDGVLIGIFSFFLYPFEVDSSHIAIGSAEQFGLLSVLWFDEFLEEFACHNDDIAVSAEEVEVSTTRCSTLYNIVVKVPDDGILGWEQPYEQSVQQ